MNHGTRRVRIGDVHQQIGGLDPLTIQSQLRFNEIIQRFERFALKGFGVDLIEGVTADLVDQFMRSKGDTGEPSTATMHIRRASLRLLFRIARLEFGFEGDPTLDLVLPPRTMLSTRPLTDDEIAVGRSYSLKTFTATRQPAAWALGEAGATTSALPHVTIDDLDLDNSRVWLHGSTKRVDRWAAIDSWGMAQLTRRASAIRGTPNLIYTGDGGFAAQISCCNAIKETLVRAGLDKEPDIRPASLAAWAGRKIFEESGSIEETARRLGMRSLDAATRFINHDWQ